jgi:hypothetical protein
VTQEVMDFLAFDGHYFSYSKCTEYRQLTVSLLMCYLNHAWKYPKIPGGLAEFIWMKKDLRLVRSKSYDEEHI